MLSLSMFLTLAWVLSLARLASSRGDPLISNGLLSEETYLNQTILSKLNGYRLQHYTPALVWSDTLYSNALEVAQVACPMVVPRSVRNNERIRSESIECTDKNITATGYAIQSIAYISGWYSTCQSYGNTTHSGGDQFTKMVWKGTTDVACAWSPEPNAVDANSHCAARFKFVCLYYPPGNAEGANATEEYTQNVSPGHCKRQH